MLRIRLFTIAVATTAAAAALLPAAGGAEKADTFPDVIQLPKGFQPEGIEVGKGTTFFVGSVANGAIWRGNLRTGQGSEFIAGGGGRSATGIEFDQRKQRLFVAGAATGNAYIFNARNGTLLRTYQLATAPTFINDVVVTRRGAYFTDSNKPVLYKVPIGKSGRLGDAQTANARLYRIDPATGVATTIQLANGESVPNGDGILLHGKTLYVVQNRSNVVAVIDLSRSLTSGTVRTRLSDSDFDVPTTIDELGHRLYAVNARFGNADPANADYQVVQLTKRR
jgi:sugar lactone lactonase YvrE